MSPLLPSQGPSSPSRPEVSALTFRMTAVCSLICLHADLENSEAPYSLGGGTRGPCDFIPSLSLGYKRFITALFLKPLLHTQGMKPETKVNCLKFSFFILETTAYKNQRDVSYMKNTEKFPFTTMQTYIVLSFDFSSTSLIRLEKIRNFNVV